MPGRPPDDVSVRAMKTILEALDECRRLKHELSMQSAWEVEVGEPPDNIIFGLTRPELEEMIGPLVDQTVECCSGMITSAQRDWSGIDDVLLVGGSSRLPVVRSRLERLVRVVRSVVEPELAVSQGAAIYARNQVRLARSDSAHLT